MSARVHRLDPARETHYAIGEEGEWRLRELAEALDFVAALADGFDAQVGEVEERGMGPLLRVFSRGIADAIATRAVVVPRAAA